METYGDLTGIDDPNLFGYFPAPVAAGPLLGRRAAEGTTAHSPSCCW